MENGILPAFSVFIRILYKRELIRRFMRMRSSFSAVLSFPDWNFLSILENYFLILAREVGLTYFYFWIGFLAAFAGAFFAGAFLVAVFLAGVFLAVDFFVSAFFGIFLVLKSFQAHEIIRKQSNKLAFFKII